MEWERSPDGVRWEPGAVAHSDDADWWFRARVAPEADAVLRFESLATDAVVSLDGVEVASSCSMWRALDVPVPAGSHEVVVHCRPLAAKLATRRKPRARWRTRGGGNALRFDRTTLVGRAPGFAPGPPVVGLPRPARLLPGGPPPVVRLRPRVEGSVGVLAVDAPGDVTVRLGASSVTGGGELRVEGVAPWFPHTHGSPVLYDVSIARGDAAWSRRVGFRALTAVGDVLRDGVDLRVNDVGVFVRGAVWTPVPAGEERATLARVVAAGFNAVRIVGWGAYETAAFHDLCDELGILVWQDLMFANLDYPFSDDAFRAECRAEVAEQLEVVAGRPSLAVVCGSSESEQQVAMLGLDPALAREPFFAADVPELLAGAGVDAIYVPSAPSGAGRPIRPDEGVAHWFGVGGYRRPLRDVRAAGVRFAAECLAFANLPDGDAEGFVPRDVGADWDFADVREHYRSELFLGARGDVLERLVTGEVMAEVFGDWRRAGSVCRGGIVLELRDRVAGAGWGLLDVTGRPKGALGPLARVLAPVAIWTTDEGQSGLAVQVANDRPSALEATVRVTVYRDGEHVVQEASVPVVVPAHGAWSADVEALLGRWLDVGYCYRFGPPQHDLVVVALERDGELVSHHARRPVPGPPTVLTADELGLQARFDGDAVVIAARRAVLGVRLRLDGFEPADDGFTVEPGRPRRVALGGRGAPGGRIQAINLQESTPIRV